MAKRIDAYAHYITFSEDGITLYYGDKMVSHNQLRKDKTELEQAEEMIDRYLHGKCYNEWLKIVRIIYQINKSLKKMMNDELWIEFLKSDSAKDLLQLKKNVLDTSLNEMWVIK